MEELNKTLKLLNDPEFISKANYRLEIERDKFWKKEGLYLLLGGLIFWAVCIAFFKYASMQPISFSLVSLAGIVPLGLTVFLLHSFNPR